MLHNLKRNTSLVLALSALPLVSACAANPVSTHSENYMRELHSGRVQVISYVTNPAEKNVAQVSYYYPDGTHSTCWRGYNEPAYSIGNNNRWKIISETKSRTRLKGFAPGEEASAGYGNPFTYNPSTGLLTAHSWDGSKGKWYDTTERWFQDSYPRAFVDACPGLELPADLPINEKQTSLDWYELKEQDPSAIIKNFKPSYGDENSTWEPPVNNLDNIKAFARTNSGMVLKDPENNHWLYNNRNSQMWQLDDNLDITDIGQVTTENADNNVVVKWLNAPQTVIDVNDPLPLEVTQTRHPAFEFTDWLAEQDIAEFKFDEHPDFMIRFFADYYLKAAPKNYTLQDGQWSLDGNNISFTLTDTKGQSRAFSEPWKEVAKQTTWPGAKSLN